MNASAINMNTPTGTGWRKFSLACFASVAGTVLCYVGKLSGSEWVAMQSLVLGIFGTANVIDKKFGGAG
jgi:hypothetical protein